MSRKALGRGLGALMPQMDESSGGVGKEIPIAKIVPNPYQPRRQFSEETLAELAESIKQRGVLQPVSVREIDGGYELVAGERRLRAAKQAGLKTIPAVVHKDMTDQQVMEVALIENLQRDDLNPIEEARAYQRLIDEFDLTQEEIARVVGKSRSTVANALRLLGLAPEVQKGLTKGDIAPGHARALLGFSQGDQVRLYKRIVEEGLTVRQIEKLAKQGKGKGKERRKRQRQAEELDPAVRDVQERLQGVLGTRVKIQPSSKSGKGKIEVEYYSVDDLQRILDLVMGKEPQT